MPSHQMRLSEALQLFVRVFLQHHKPEGKNCPQNWLVLLYAFLFVRYSPLDRDTLLRLRKTHQWHQQNVKSHQNLAPLLKDLMRYDIFEMLGEVHLPDNATPALWRGDRAVLACTLMLKLGLLPSSFLANRNIITAETSHPLAWKLNWLLIYLRMLQDQFNLPTMAHEEIVKPNNFFFSFCIQRWVKIFLLNFAVVERAYIEAIIKKAIEHSLRQHQGIPASLKFPSYNLAAELPAQYRPTCSSLASVDPYPRRPSHFPLPALQKATHNLGQTLTLFNQRVMTNFLWKVKNHDPSFSSPFVSFSPQYFSRFGAPVLQYRGLVARKGKTNFSEQSPPRGAALLNFLDEKQKSEKNFSAPPKSPFLIDLIVRFERIVCCDPHNKKTEPLGFPAVSCLVTRELPIVFYYSHKQKLPIHIRVCVIDFFNAGQTRLIRERQFNLLKYPDYASLLQAIELLFRDAGIIEIPVKSLPEDTIELSDKIDWAIRHGDPDLVSNFLFKGPAR